MLRWLVLLLVLSSGCLEGQTPTASAATDTRVNGLISGMLNNTGTPTGAAVSLPSAVEQPATTTTYKATDVPTSTTSTTSTQTSTTIRRVSTTTTTSSTTTVEEVQGIECSKIPQVLGPQDCEPGTCPEGLKCIYLPGNLYRPAKCACARRP